MDASAKKIVDLIISDVERTRSFGVSTQKEYWLRITPPPPDSKDFHDEVSKRVWMATEAGVVWISSTEVRIHLVPPTISPSHLLRS
jgi:hypothetical protein